MRQKNRRKFIRLFAYHLAKYRLTSGELENNDFTAAMVGNISAGGCCLLSEENLPVASTLEIQINFPNLSHPVTARAKICWSKKIVKINRYKFGIEFTEIDETDRSLINEQIKYVEEAIREGTLKNILVKGGERLMKPLAKIFLVFALACIILAISIKLTTIGTIIPGAMPINWIKLADTALLCTIALALLADKAK